MAGEARLKYGTFSLGGDVVGSVVHLRSALPEVIALGTDTWLEFKRGIPPMGGPHAEVHDPEPYRSARLHVTTPECSFTYELLRMELDTAGWYLVMRRTYVSTAYAAFAEALRG